eukprot:symbB.v1.2.013728.t1/scaffold977.1/size148281/11
MMSCLQLSCRSWEGSPLESLPASHRLSPRSSTKISKSLEQLQRPVPNGRRREKSLVHRVCNELSGQTARIRAPQALDDEQYVVLSMGPGVRPHP